MEVPPDTAKRDQLQFAAAKSVFLAAKARLDAAFDDDYATFEKRYTEQTNQAAKGGRFHFTRSPGCDDPRDTG